MRLASRAWAGRPAKVLVVAADAGRARFFRAARRDGELIEQEDLLNPAARVAVRAVATDRQGHVSNGARAGGHAFAPHEDPLRHETANFARTVARRLIGARCGGAADRIYLVADPRFLGLLRAALDAPTRRLVAGEVGKDMTRHRAASIRSRLAPRL